MPFKKHIILQPNFFFKSFYHVSLFFLDTTKFISKRAPMEIWTLAPKTHWIPYIKYVQNTKRFERIRNKIYFFITSRNVRCRSNIFDRFQFAIAPRLHIPCTIYTNQDTSCIKISQIHTVFRFQNNESTWNQSLR